MIYCVGKGSDEVKWMKRKKILYLTDLNYQAKGRVYSEEDLFITDQLKNDFDITLSHPKDAERLEDDADFIVFRNTGSVIGYQEVYESFVKRVHEKQLKTFNTFNGKADMCGKQYLIDLTLENYPVIPTVDTTENLHQLPETDRYVIKPKGGADSIGLEFVAKEELSRRRITNGETLIQPQIDFDYEVSFYFINDTFEYAMYAPDPTKRWAMKEYPYRADDVDFAKSFIDWNTLEYGIQRVDACRTKDGKLLLVELEDLNPYLSLLETGEATCKRFLQDFTLALQKM